MDERDPDKRRQTRAMIAPQTGRTPTPWPHLNSGAPLETDVQAHIGRQLRAVYDEVVKEPVPDRFIKLIEDLERKRAGRS